MEFQLVPERKLQGCTLQAAQVESARQRRDAIVAAIAPPHRVSLAWLRAGQAHAVGAVERQRDRPLEVAVIIDAELLHAGLSLTRLRLPNRRGARQQPI